MSDDQNRQVFREEAFELLAELEMTLLELENDTGNLDLVNMVFRILHTIKGSGAMFGFEDISEFTHEIESVFDKIRNQEISVSHELLELSFKARDHIQQMLENSDDGSEIDPGRAESILDGLRRVASGEYMDEDMEDMEDMDSGVPDVCDSTSENDSGQKSEHRFIIQIRAREESNHQSFPIEPVFAELAKLGECEVRVNAERIPILSSLDPGTVYIDWELSLITTATEEEVNDVFFFSDVELLVDVKDETSESDNISKPVSSKVESARASDVEENSKALPFETEKTSSQMNPVELAPAVSRNKPVVEDGKKPVARKTEPQKPDGNMPVKKAPESVSSLRVSAEKLDYLVDLVGELVIVQAQISQVVGDRNDPVLTVLAEELERLSDELRDSTLGIRMLPIGTTFSKFRRLVRDLSSELGKQINLSTQGAETELDKTVIERLGDPLVHLLRNSIDHAIELPEDRVAAGKNPDGQILLSAEHSGGEVLIRIKDDGRGMDVPGIRAKAIERGLISSDAELTDKELLKLIFEPGFSMAREVTNVSGRGVGMDVVKRAIDSLRGVIDINSQSGEGTTITIRLPLTLAIIDGLQVKVGSEFYVIPLSLVEECVELTRAQVEDRENQSIIHLRGEIVPYVNLREWFTVEGKRPSIEQIVVTGVDGSRIGIVVDHVVGEHQTVIKSLGKVYKDVEGISGATIKGDGSIALILDVPTLVRQVAAETA